MKAKYTKIAVMKVDGKGRITIPTHFMKANNIVLDSTVEMRPKFNSNNEVILKFKNGENNE